VRAVAQLRRMRVCAGTYERVVLGLEKSQSGDKLVPFFAAEDHSARPTVIAANCSGKILVAGFADDLLRVYSMDALKEIGLLDKHSGTPTGISFMHGDNLMLCVAEDGALSVWRVADWECLAVCPSQNKKKRAQRNQQKKQNKKDFEVEGDEEE
jgi:WD40 repeat protein